MAKRRIVSFLCSTVFISPLLNIKVIQTPLEPTQGIDCVERIDFRNSKVVQIEELAKVESQKRKEAEIEKQKKEAEEIERQRLEELNKARPHFNPYDVTELSNLSKEQLYEVLKETHFVTLIDALYWYEQVYSLNSIFIIGVIALESNWGKSSLAISHNNLSGYIGKNGEYYYFNSWGESLEETFRLISEEYVNENGLFYNGKSVWLSLIHI